MDRRPPPFDGYLFDLDGTVYLGGEALPGAVEALARLRARDARVAFLSNNPTRTREQYVHKLTALGVQAEFGEVINASYALVRWLTREAPGCRVFVVGEAALKRELEDAGFSLSERAGEVDFVVSSFDRTFDYRKLQLAYDAVERGARLVATNPDRYCPVPGGGEPDCAAMTAAIEACTGVQAEAVVGKPSALMAQIALELIGVAPQGSVMVGDRLGTDILMGQRAGMATALTLTGETTRALLAASEVQPDFVIEGLLELIA